MFLRYTMLQLFSIYRCATCNVISPVKYIRFIIIIIIIIIIIAAAVVFTCITTSVTYRTVGWLVLNDQLGMMCNEVTWYKVLLRLFSGQTEQHRQIASLYPESGSNSRVHSVADLLNLQFVLHVMLFRPWNMFYYYYCCYCCYLHIVVCHTDYTYRTFGWLVLNDQLVINVRKPPDIWYYFDIFPDSQGNIDKLRLCIRAVGRDLNPLPPEYRIGCCAMDGN